MTAIAERTIGWPFDAADGQYMAMPTGGASGTKQSDTGGTSLAQSWASGIYGGAVNALCEDPRDGGLWHGVANFVSTSYAGKLVKWDAAASPPTYSIVASTSVTTDPLYDVVDLAWDGTYIIVAGATVNAGTNAVDMSKLARLDPSTGSQVSTLDLIGIGGLTAPIVRGVTWDGTYYWVLVQNDNQNAATGSTLFQVDWAGTIQQSWASPMGGSATYPNLGWDSRTGHLVLVSSADGWWWLNWVTTAGVLRSRRGAPYEPASTNTRIDAFALGGSGTELWIGRGSSGADNIFKYDWAELFEQNLANVDTLSWYCEAYNDVNWADDTVTLAVRIEAYDGTILAGSDGVGGFQTIGTVFAKTVQTFGPTAFAYVNTTATKAQWNSANVIFRQTYSNNMGGDGSGARIRGFTVQGTGAIAGNQYVETGLQASATATVSLPVEAYNANHYVDDLQVIGTSSSKVAWEALDAVGPRFDQAYSTYNQGDNLFAASDGTLYAVQHSEDSARTIYGEWQVYRLEPDGVTWVPIGATAPSPATNREDSWAFDCVFDDAAGEVTLIALSSADNTRSLWAATFTIASQTWSQRYTIPTYSGGNYSSIPRFNMSATRRQDGEWLVVAVIYDSVADAYAISLSHASSLAGPWTTSLLTTEIATESYYPRLWLVQAPNNRAVLTTVAAQTVVWMLLPDYSLSGRTYGSLSQGTGGNVCRPAVFSDGGATKCLIPTIRRFGGAASLPVLNWLEAANVDSDTPAWTEGQLYNGDADMPRIGGGPGTPGAEGFYAAVAAKGGGCWLVGVSPPHDSLAKGTCTVTMQRRMGGAWEARVDSGTQVILNTPNPFNSLYYIDQETTYHRPVVRSDGGISLISAARMGSTGPDNGRYIALENPNPSTAYLEPTAMVAVAATVTGTDSLGRGEFLGTSATAIVSSTDVQAAVDDTSLVINSATLGSDSLTQPSGTSYADLGRAASGAVAVTGTDVAHRSEVDRQVAVAATTMATAVQHFVEDLEVIAASTVVETDSFAKAPLIEDVVVDVTAVVTATDVLAATDSTLVPIFSTVSGGEVGAVFCWVMFEGALRKATPKVWLGGAWHDVVAIKRYRDGVWV